MKRQIEVKKVRRVKNSINLLLGLSLACLAACDSGDSDEREEIIRPVRFTKVMLDDGMMQRVFSGSSEAKLESSLSFKVSGTLQVRDASIGDQLQAGQVIAKLDPTDFNISINDAEASLANAQAQMRSAKSSYERTKTLYENDNTSKLELDSARAASESAAAQVESAIQKLRSARLQLSYTRLHSPGVCTVADTFAKVNENVSAGMAILKVNCGECANVKIVVPGSFVNQISSGEEVQVSFGALSEQSYRATVTEIGVASANTSSAFPVTVALQEGCDQIRSGMAADVAFETMLGNGQSNMRVPQVSVGEDGQGKYVFVLEQDSSGDWFARRRSIELGEFVPPGLTISSGLREGELIVTAGVRRIVDGQKVKMLPEMEQ